jgi:hypothetical protein
MFTTDKFRAHDTSALLRAKASPATTKLGAFLRRIRYSTAIVLVTSMVGLPVAQAAQQCFDQAGTFGNLTVTTAGTGCGTFLNYGGITGIWEGDGNITENCTFNFSPAINGTTMTVALTAHSCTAPASACEDAVFSVNGSHYVVAPGDVNNAVPAGGEAVIITGTGDIRDMTAGPVPGDGRATITFGHAPASTTSLDINHVIVVGNPNGTIYLVCADDGPAGPAVVTVVPTLSPWALYGLPLLLAGMGFFFMRKQRSRGGNQS